LIPLLPFISEEIEKVSGRGSVCYLIFDFLILISASLFIFSKSPRSSSIDQSMFVSALVFSVFVFISGLLTQTEADTFGGDKGILLLIHTLLPYIWFLSTWRAFPSFGYYRTIGMSLIAGTVIAAIWYLLNMRGLQAGYALGFWTTVSLSSGVNHNTLGLMYAIAVAMLLPVRMASNRWLKPLVIVFLTVALLLTFSRSAYIALSCALILLFFIKRRGWLFSITLILAIVGIMLLFPFLMETSLERVSYTLGSGSLDVSSQTRVLLWKSSLTAAVHNPVFGIGFGKSLAEWDYGLRLSPSRLIFSHNYFLTLLSQLGLVGFLLGSFLLMKGYLLSNRPDFGDLGVSVRMVLATVIVASFFGEPLLWQGTLLITMILLRFVSSARQS